jgi:hypothetical protein
LKEKDGFIEGQILMKVLINLINLDRRKRRRIFLQKLCIGAHTLT